MGQKSKTNRPGEKQISSINVIDEYQKRYIDISFERSGLFHIVQTAFDIREVLYPGCSIHITPSFYFSHVVYIDRSKVASDFFTAMEQIMQYVERKKVYRQSAYLRFIAQDYHRPIALKDQHYDMLLALYAADAIQPCLKYLKRDGLLLVQEIDFDKISDHTLAHFTPVSIIHFSRGKYQLKTLHQGKMERPATRKKMPVQFLHQSSQGLVYREITDYYVLRKKWYE